MLFSKEIEIPQRALLSTQTPAEQPLNFNVWGKLIAMTSEKQCVV